MAVKTFEELIALAERDCIGDRGVRRQPVIYPRDEIYEASLVVPASKSSGINTQ